MSENPIRLLVYARPPRDAWLRSFHIPLMQLALIGVGIWADSPAMQWAGFLTLALIVFVVSFCAMGKSPMTIAEARAFLDELEARDHTAKGAPND